MITFLDDCTVLGKSFEEAYDNLEEVLGCFQKHGLKVKPKKCDLFKFEVELLGHLVNKDGIQILDCHSERVRDWNPPTSRKEMESFLGFVNYLRDFIPHYAEIADPLYKSIVRTRAGEKKKKNWSIVLTEEELESFEKVKEAVASVKRLCYPDPEHTFILDVDSSLTGIGGSLSQCIEGETKVISYASFSLTATQRKYCATKLELLGVIRMLRHFRHYLLGKRFLCRTDHASLQWLMNFRNCTGQIGRWQEEIACYDFELVYKPGAEHVVPDALSRIPDGGTFCPNYEGNVEPKDLPCAPCDFCNRAQKQWGSFFEDVDYVKPLSLNRTMISKIDEDFKDWKEFQS